MAGQTQRWWKVQASIEIRLMRLYTVGTADASYPTHGSRGITDLFEAVR